jgi:hypothetical protein
MGWAIIASKQLVVSGKGREYTKLILPAMVTEGSCRK